MRVLIIVNKHLAVRMSSNRDDDGKVEQTDKSGVGDMSANFQGHVTLMDG